MTLATLPRYDSEQVSDVGGHAVVVGGGVAGLLAARVLADGFQSVTVVERDPLPAEPMPRTGVPHGEHPHALLEAGRAVIEDLSPGFVEALVDRGGVPLDGLSDFKFFDEGDFLADGPTPMPMYAATRPLIELVLRERVAAIDGVRIRGDCRCTAFRMNDAGTAIEGVSVREDGVDLEDVDADLVVDATGRTSRTPSWLESQGYASPPLDEVKIDLAYSTLLVERPPGNNTALLGPAAPPHSRGGSLAPVQGDRWQVTLHGVHGDHPPTDVGGFMDYARNLPFPQVERILREHPPVPDSLDHYPFPSNRRHRYEELDRFPAGLVVIGDAIASFNPIYGQGMSVAALEALVLHHELSEDGRGGLARRYFDRVEEVVDIAWTMAVGADFQFAETTGPKPFGTDLIARYLSRLSRKAHTDGWLRERLFRVFMMEVPPTSLFHPAVLVRVLSPFGGPPGGLRETAAALRRR